MYSILSNPRGSGSKSAFTLIELLVVVAIIALLAAILFPVFETAREKARQSSCASNEKQIGLGLIMYSQDSDNIYPFVGGSVSWDDKIRTYVPAPSGWGSTKQLFECPDDQLVRTSSGGGANGTRTYSLAAASVIGGPMGSNAGGGFVGPYNGSTYIYRGRNQSEFTTPATTLMVVENPSTTNNTGNDNDAFVTVPFGTDHNCNTNTDWVCGPNSQALALHNGGYNYLFTDGHVKWYNPASTAVHGWAPYDWETAGGFWTINNAVWPPA